jgi:BirA family transcriptional regulator, biotin operon repressor / biotin---[acetyl-CoA-carboxylase] ligase
MNKHHKIGEEIIDLREIDSTNNYAMRLINQGIASHGLVIKADYQTSGKGQHGNIWSSEQGKNLLLSVILDTQAFPLEDQFILNACFCNAVATLLMERYEIKDVRIKWPNDIYVGNRKIAGILMENVLRGSVWQYAIVGIGINVNQDQFPLLHRATSLNILLEKEQAIKQCEQFLLKEMNANYKAFRRAPDHIFKEYQQMLVGFEESISFLKKGEMFSASVVGVTQSGELELLFDGSVKKYRHKEIELILD